MSNEFGQQSLIAVVLPQLRGYGVQRMRLNIVETLVERGYQVELVVGSKRGIRAARVPRNVAVRSVAERGSVWFLCGFFLYMLRSKPTHILTSQDDISAVVLLVNKLLRSPAKVLASVHNSMKDVAEEGGVLSRYKNALVSRILLKLYPRATSIVAVSNGLASELSERMKLPVESIKVIYNPVITRDFFERMAATLPPDMLDAGASPLIGFVGRLHPQKRVDILIRAFAGVRSRRECKLLLVGGGDEETSLRKLALELDIVQEIAFLGYSDNPLPIMKALDVMVLPSDYEGLGNVLVEALACGVQVISSDCPHGPAEILEGGRWGQLFPIADVEALEIAIEKSLTREFWVEPNLLADRGMQFSSERATSEYLEALRLPPYSASY